MRQIDILISDQQKEYLEREQSLKTQLQRQERELSTMRVTIQERNAEVGVSKEIWGCPVHTNDLQVEKMKLQNNGSVKHQIAFYEDQVTKLRAEVSMNYACDYVYHSTYTLLRWHMYTYASKTLNKINTV